MVILRRTCPCIGEALMFLPLMIENVLQVGASRTGQGGERQSAERGSAESGLLASSWTIPFLK